MFLEKPDPDRRRPHRRKWTLPPPPVGSAEGLEGAEVLEELPNGLGLALFEVVRDVMFWNRSPENERTQLFARRRASDRVADLVPASILPEYKVLRNLGHSRTDPKRVSDACSHLATWAYDTGHIGTAVLFAHAAANVTPSDPEKAFAVGRATRDAGRLSHAEAWFQRTIGLARRTQNPQMQTAGYFGLGVLHEMRSDSKAARATFEKALRTATAGGLAAFAAVAHQYLIPLDVKDFPAAMEHAQAALRLFPADDLRLSRLAVDAGALFSEHGNFKLALALYEGALPFLARASDRLAVNANIGRAAAALKMKIRFAEAWGEFDRIALQPVPQFFAESLAELAFGAATLGYWKHAARMVERAMQLAQVSGTPRTRHKIERLQQIVEQREGGDVDKDGDPRAIAFAAQLQARLAALTPSN